MAARGLKSLDVYPKLQEELKVRTWSGAVVSLCAVGLMVVLFFSELALFLSTERVDHLKVDTAIGSQSVKMEFDIVFPQIPCTLLSLDVMDASGTHQMGVTLVKKPLDHHGNPLGGALHVNSLEGAMKEEHVLGNAEGKEYHVAGPNPLKPGDRGYCGSCYGAARRQEQCCNTCEDVVLAYEQKGWEFKGRAVVEQCVHEEKSGMEAMKRHEGCAVAGHLMLQRVSGSFHFAPGHSFQQSHDHVHDLGAFVAGRFNVSHVIRHLSFGPAYPGIIHPLDGQERTVIQGGAVFQYYVKVVPTEYSYRNGESLSTNQFSVTEHRSNVQAKEGHGIPGVFFFYDFAPIRVHFEERSRSFSHFITQLCAIIGGIFTVAGLVDRALYHSMRAMEKDRMGKFQ